MFVGDRLKNLREQKSMTQTELANLINVTKVSVCCYESGKRTPSLETLDDISNVFGVKVDYFLGKDVPVIEEDGGKYVHFLSTEELEFIKLLRKNDILHSLIVSDPRRTVELIEKKLK